MALFHYPKSKHKRKLSPRQYKRYRSYKRTLQTEFSRICVYCRQPDSSAPNLNFGVDHYRPKGVLRFSSLICAYDNLYYCCGSCNSRKNDYWPEDEKNGPFVVAPCEHVMASHLRFNSTKGTVDSQTKEGQFTEELLQLNDVATVQYRLTTLRTISMYESEICKNELQVKAINQLLRTRKISQARFDAEMTEVVAEINDLRLTMKSYTGELPIPTLQKRRLGVVLFA